MKRYHVTYRAENRHGPCYGEIFVECESWELDGNLKALRAIRKQYGPDFVIKIFSNTEQSSEQLVDSLKEESI